MRNIARTLTLLAALALCSGSLDAQPHDLNIQHRSDIASTCFEMTMTMKYDRLDRPYLYVAGKEGGLKVYDISNLAAPVLARTIPIAQLDGLQVMNLEQSEEHLYLALGNHFNNSQSPGMAVIDVSTPASAMVADVWRSSATDGGAGIVDVEGSYAYLGAMKHGLIVLDISDKANVRFVSQLVPDINYPTMNPNPDLYNARGMEVLNDLVYLCYDAGGLRVIDVANKSAPVETGRFSNPVLNGLPRAYNNIVVDLPFAYIAVDYCGIEVLNVADPSRIVLTGWWNPYNCPGNNWFTSPVHANELGYNRECRLLLVSTGKSDLYVVSVENSSAPDSVGIYGGVENEIGTWGVDAFRENISLSYICAVIPFASNWTGVKLLTYDNVCLGGIDEPAATAIDLRVSPAGDRLVLPPAAVPFESASASISVTDALGRTFFPAVTESSASGTTVDISDLAEGFWILQVRAGGASWTGKFIKVRR